MNISATNAPSRSALRSQAATGDPGSVAASGTDADSDVAASLYSSYGVEDVEDEFLERLEQGAITFGHGVENLALP